MNLNFKIDYLQTSKNYMPMINIKTSSIKENNSFSYANIYGMYKTTQGHGIQVNRTELRKPLGLMCDKIAQAIYDFQKDINDL